MAAGERRAQRQSLAAPLDVARRPAVVDVDTIEARPRRRRFAPSTRPRARACSARRSRMRGSRSPITAGRPGLKMPAFSRGDLLERRAEILHVIEADRRDAGDERDPATFVESSRPPSPASMTATSAPRAREVVERHRGRRLEEARADLLDQRQVRRVMKSTTSSAGIGSPPTTIRSRKSTRCGDV